MASRNKVTATATVSLSTLAESYLASCSTAKDANQSAVMLAKPIAAYFDTYGNQWTQVKLGKAIPTMESMSEEKLNKLASDIGFNLSQAKELALFRIELSAACKTKGIDPASTFQNIQRHSMGYTGSKPLHPDVQKASAEAKASQGSKEDKAKSESATTTEICIADLVTADPKQARLVLVQVIEGLMANKALRTKNKVSVVGIVEVLEALTDACELLAKMK